MARLTDEDRGDLSLIDGYAPDAFRIGGVLHGGAVLVARGLVVAWPVAGLGDASAASLAPLLDGDIDIELLILGCGPRIELPPPALSSALRERRIGLEPMDTGAACRTYNLLLIEERRVAAALLPAGAG